MPVIGQAFSPGLLQAALQDKNRRIDRAIKRDELNARLKNENEERNLRAARRRKRRVGAPGPRAGTRAQGLPTADSRGPGRLGGSAATGALSHGLRCHCGSGVREAARGLPI